MTIHANRLILGFANIASDFRTLVVTAGREVCVSTPNGLGSFLEKHIFDPFLTSFCSRNAHFQGFLGCCRGQNGSKRAQNGLISLDCAPQMVHDQFWKTRFSPIFDPFLVPKWPILGFSTGHHRQYLFEHPQWSGNTFGKKFFFAPSTMLDPPLAPTMRSPGSPLAPPSD